MAKKKVLGKGMESLLQENLFKGEGQKTVSQYMPIGEIRPNPNQPRKSFHEKDLEELSQSIREIGILEPLIVTRPTRGLNSLPEKED